MSRKGIQAFSAGIITATAILSISYFLTPKEAAESEKATEEQVSAYLASEGQVSVSRDTYETLVKAKEATVSEPSKTEEAPAKTEETPAKTESPSKKETFRFFIYEGTSTAEIAQKLEQGKVIKSANEFADYLIDTDLHTKVRQGGYKLPTGLSNEEAAKYLIKQ
ncbi:hypothetical protein J9317_13065 [Metabacillus sp. KIGAM252]|uniref:Endolytic transglycosylase MltG n=1 Tax=Metabacillus flavus TaxID=2823519 RepID=A0ABS5LGF9_9BACI|nr:hypothetical protein [Metabacillus flavus]MBS2969696.1 hypothetical protein [Metabacillus flavus]